MIKQHAKIQELRLKAKPITISGSYVDEEGNVHMADFKIKVVEEEDRIIEGYLSVFGVKDMCGEVTVKGCFAKSIKERGPQSNARAKIAFLWQHNMEEPLGQFIELKEDDYGLYFKAKLDPIPEADRALIQIKSGTLNQFSIGYQYVWDKMRYDEDNDSIVLMEVILYEGSVVTIGCNTETYAIKSAADLIAAKENLDAETEMVLKTLPRNKQLEVRQLLSKHISLASIQPGSPLDTKGDDSNEATLIMDGYKLNINQL